MVSVADRLIFYISFALCFDTTYMDAFLRYIFHHVNIIYLRFFLVQKVLSVFYSDLIFNVCKSFEQSLHSRVVC